MKRLVVAVLMIVVGLGACGPKSPPQLEQRYIRVSGDFVASWNLVVDTSAVPVRGPVMKKILFSGDSASIDGAISSW